MAYRRPGTLLPLERRILEVAVSRAPEGVYGFALAQELATNRDRERLIAHGTLYKALDRMRRTGMFTATWEDAEAAAAEGRPRRRVYLVTAKGVQTLEAAAASTSGAPRLGQAPA